MKSVFVGLCLAASFAESCASNTETTRERLPVHLEMSEPPLLSLQAQPSSVSTVAPGGTGTPTQVPDYYLGVGARGLKGDPLAAVIGAKLKLTDISGLSFSTRPEVLLGGFDSPEWRLPFTVEGSVNKYGFAWFGGGGLSYNMDDLGETDAMVTGGINIPLSERWVLNLQINYMWQHAIDDLDGEFIVTLNYGL